MDRGFCRAVRGLLLLGCLTGNPGNLRAQDEAGTEVREPGAATAKSPLVVEPKSPDELFEATGLMVDIARVDLAKLYLDKLLEEQLDDDLLLALRDKYGPGAFLKLTQIPQLKTSASRLLDLSNAAAIKRAGDRDRIARLIRDLEGDPEQEAAAQSEIESLGAAVVPGMLTVLNNPDLADRHEPATLAILRVGEPGVPLLIGALNSPNQALRATVATILGHLRSATAVPYLWYPALARDGSPEVRDAAREALQKILKLNAPGLDRLATDRTIPRMLETVREHFRNAYPWIVDDTGLVTLWSWDTAQGTVVPRQVTPEEASESTGLRFAREALAIEPNLRSAQLLYLCLALAADIRRTGFDKPLPQGPGTAHDLALAVGADLATDVISEAINAARPSVAVAALKVFSQTGTLGQLKLSGSLRSVVVTALDYPDERVQFAAANAILQIDPPASFRGAVRVVDILKRSLVTDGKAHAVVGEVSADRGARLGGMLRELCYDPLVFTSGREAFTAAAERTDVELIILHPNLIRWSLSETLANLRADARTASIPIVIHGPSRLTGKMEHQTRSFRLVSFAASSETTEGFDFQLRPFLRQIKTTAATPLTPQERIDQRATAVAWLAHIAQGRRTKVFDINLAEPELLGALKDEKLAPLALEALGEIASRASQQGIVDLLLDGQSEADLRRAAAFKLAWHIQRFGLLLSKPALEGLHRVWGNPRESAELRTAVGGVIGSLKPDTELAGKRLLQQSGRPQ
jgi:HEAT repeat protein